MRIFQTWLLGIGVSWMLFSCNRIETGQTLRPSDITYIQQLKLLEPGETIYKFYSEYTRKTAGNFFTNRRIAKYWIDRFHPERTTLSSALYPDIQSIDTVFNAGLTWCPYMRITKRDGTQFNVSVEGKHRQVKAFFEDAMRLWRQNRWAKLHDECVVLCRAEAPGGLHFWGGAESFLQVGGSGGDEAGEGGELRAIGGGFLVDDEAHAGEEVGGGFEVAEFLFFYIVLLQELVQGVARVDEGGVEVFLDVDVGGDPVAAAALEYLADVAAELFFFGQLEVYEEAFVDDDQRSGRKAVGDGFEGGGVEDVEGGDFVVAGVFGG